jgi:hypothetical protein
LLEGEEVLLDENGNPIILQPGTGEGMLPGEPQPETPLDEDFIDRALGRRPPPPEPEEAVDPFIE